MGIYLGIYPRKIENDNIKTKISFSEFKSYIKCLGCRNFETFLISSSNYCAGCKGIGYVKDQASYFRNKVIYPYTKGVLKFSNF